MVTTPNEVRALFEVREKLLQENGITIASKLPITWQAVIGNLPKTVDESTFRIVDVELLTQEDTVVFTLHDSNTNGLLKQTLPLLVVIDAELSHNPLDPNLIRFLNQNPAREFSQDNRETGNHLEEVLRITQQQYPNMFIDIPRMILVEQKCADGEMFKMPFYDTMH